MNAEFAIGDRVIHVRGNADVGTVRSVRGNRVVVAWDGFWTQSYKATSLRLADAVSVADRLANVEAKHFKRGERNAELRGEREAARVYEIKIETTRYGVSKVRSGGRFETAEQAADSMKYMPFTAQERAWIEG